MGAGKSGWKSAQAELACMLDTKRSRFPSPSTSPHAAPMPAPPSTTPAVAAPAVEGAARQLWAEAVPPYFLAKKKPGPALPSHTGHEGVKATATSPALGMRVDSQ